MNTAQGLTRGILRNQFLRTLLMAFLTLLPNLSLAGTISVASSPGNTATIRTNNGNLLRNAINTAATTAGPTTILLTKGHEFMGPITLKSKSVDNAYTIIESTGIGDGTLPTSGVRVSPSNAPNMAKILAPTGSGTVAIKTENGVGVAGSHHYILRGLEVTKADNAHTYMLCEIGQDGSAPTGVNPQDTLAEVPHHIEIDQCYMHPYDNTAQLSKHIFLNAGHSKISNSYFSDAKTLASTGESQAIAVCNGTGPHWIVNNYMQAATENFMSGGGGVKLPDTPGNPNIPSDVTFKRNYCPKDLAWLPNIDPATGYPNWTSSSADKWLVKNLFEIKFGRRFDVQGNVFENTWGQYAGQEFAVAIKNVTNSTSVSANECKTYDVLFKYNKISHAAGAIATEGRDYNRGFAPELRRITIEHNLFEDVTASLTPSGPGWGYTTLGLRGSFHYISHGGYDVRVQHNTCFNNGSIIAFHTHNAPNDYKPTGYVLSNNVVQGSGTKNIQGDTPTVASIFGTAAINGFAPTMNFVHNAVKTSTTSGITGAHLSDNWWPTAWTAGVILVNHAGGNYNVVNPSVYYTNASPGDGKPIGADLTALNAATVNCTTGNWTDKDIVLYASNSTSKTSHWTVVADPLAAGEAYLSESNTGLSQTTPLASPTSYFELTFSAVANTPYHLWIRGRAPSNQTTSDSVHVQFTNTLTAIGGSAAYRIGTTSAMEWRLQNGSSDTIAGWGWRDTKIAGVTSEKQVIFATTGTQTIRIQRFEDGPQIDQILLSPNTYLGRGPNDANPEIAAALSNPGYEDNDTTILMKTSGSSSPPPPPPGEVIIDNPAATLTGTWTSSTNVAGYLGSNYIHDGNTGKGTKTCRWTPNLPAAGTYDVYARWTSATDRATNSPYAIVHSGGTANVTVNQQTQGGVWVLLGTWSFNAGTAGYVQLSTGGTNGFVIADGVRFVSVATPPIAYDNFNYTGSLNTQNGGTGFANAWTAISGQASPALATGTMTYTDGANSLVSGGNKLQPAVSSRSSRNFASAIATNGLVKWISFRINQTDTGALPTNHAGFGVYSGLAGGGTEIFLGKPGSATNYGISHSGTWTQKSGAVTASDRDAFLVYKLDFTTAGSVTISMWIDRPLNEASLGSPDATFTKAHSATSLQSMLVSTGTNAVNFQLDEFRIGDTFDAVAPK